MKEGWRRNEGGMEEGWRRGGGGMERDGGGVEEGWRRDGGGMEEGWRRGGDEEDTHLVVQSLFDLPGDLMKSATIFLFQSHNIILLGE